MVSGGTTIFAWTQRYAAASATASPEIGSWRLEMRDSGVETEVEFQTGGNPGRQRSWARWRSTLLRGTNRGTKSLAGSDAVFHDL